MNHFDTSKTIDITNILHYLIVQVCVETVLYEQDPVTDGVCCSV